MNDSRVLVLSSNPLIAALIGALAEGEGQESCFPATGENLRDAVRRCRAGLVIVDADDPTSCTDELLGPVRMTGSQIVLFSHRRSREDVLETVTRYEAEHIALPAELPKLLGLLNGRRTRIRPEPTT